MASSNSASCQSKAIFQPIGSSDLLFSTYEASIVLKDSFTLEDSIGYPVKLFLSDTILFLQDATALSPSHYCRLTFEIKEEVIYERTPVSSGLGKPVAFVLEREGSSNKLRFSSKDRLIMEKWVEQLEKKINQKNFDRLFKAKKRIGKGSFASVYLATRLRDNKLVAVKAFSKERQYAGEKGKSSLENEVQIMRKLTNPYVMKFLALYESENSIYIILEYLQGTQLNNLLKDREPISLRMIRPIMTSLLRGLAYLSQQGIIHRDLKPENLMFRKDNNEDLVICDFGLATEASQEHYLFVRCGTPGYVAPEIINIKDLTLKSSPVSDVFAAGVIFHELLLGESVFAGSKYQEVLNENRKCHFDFTRPIYSRIPSNAFNLLKQMLEINPTARITAAQALKSSFFNTLESAMEDESLISDCLLHDTNYSIEPIDQCLDRQRMLLMQNVFAAPATYQPAIPSEQEELDNEQNARSEQGDKGQTQPECQQDQSESSQASRMPHKTKRIARVIRVR